MQTDRYHYYLTRQQIVTRVQVQHQAGIFYYVFTDRQGSVAAMRQGNGSVPSGNDARYDAFGGYRTKPNHTVNPGISDRGYTGHRMNNTGLDDLGLIYMNARYYVPEVGRFASPDTIVPDPGNPQSFNRYTYALNNPIKYTDPSGHCVTNDREITRDDAFDCTVDEMAQLSWETRHWWLEMLAAESRADWFRNIYGIISYFANDPQFSALDGWASLSDAGVLVVIQDGWRLSRGDSAINTSTSAMQASREWANFYALLRDFGEDDSRVASQWGVAEQAGVDYGVELAEPLRGDSDSATRAEIETFVMFGNAYRSLISNHADRILTSNLQIYGLRPQAAFDPRTNTSQIFVYLWSRYIVSPISSISSQ